MQPSKLQRIVLTAIAFLLGSVVVFWNGAAECRAQSPVDSADLEIRDVAEFDDEQFDAEDLDDEQFGNELDDEEDELLDDIDDGEREFGDELDEGEGLDDFGWLEEHRMEMEMRRMELETVREIAAIASDEVSSAAFALTHLHDFMEEDDSQEMVDFLTKAVSSTKNPAVRRLLRIKLAEIHSQMDQQEQAKEQLKSLILDN